MRPLRCARTPLLLERHWLLGDRGRGHPAQSRCPPREMHTNGRRSQAARSVRWSAPIHSITSRSAGPKRALRIPLPRPLDRNRRVGELLCHPQHRGAPHGYSGGTGGQLCLSLVADVDGTPGGLVLAQAAYAPTRANLFPRLRFPAPAPVERGRYYAIVFTNIDENPVENFASINTLYVDPAHGTRVRGRYRPTSRCSRQTAHPIRKYPIAWQCGIPSAVTVTFPSWTSPAVSPGSTSATAAWRSGARTPSRSAARRACASGSPSTGSPARVERAGSA